MAIQLASSSSSYRSKLSYDVFLSFRGIDTRKSFTSHLYNALHQRGIKTFMDDEELESGKEISPALLRAIEESKISLVIFSENYAASSWCLDELVQISECQETKGQMVLPIFYHVEPSVVRHQKGPFAKAFAKHKDTKRHSEERIHRWRTALQKAADLSGFPLGDRTEASFIERIVGEIWNKLNPVYLNVASHPVVGIEARVQEVKFMSDRGLSNVHIVGIHGTGGIGKTTIAKVLYNMIANQFEGCSFLANVRERSKQCEGLVKLQEALLSEILQFKKIKIHNSSSGINLIKERLCYKRVLLVLDDVDNLEQLKSLAGEPNWFGSGSRIIVTTRDKHLLVEYGVDQDSIYRVKELDNSNSLQLLCCNAFKEQNPRDGFEELSNKLVSYTQGLPLALVVLGSFLYGRSKEDWESTLCRLIKQPNKKIFELIKISFDGLEDLEKNIFLDIACFFKWEDIHKVKSVLDNCDFDPEIGINVLVERNLLTIEDHRLSMHDLIQDMGREIVRQESQDDPGQRSRLWLKEDIIHVLKENAGSNRVQGIKLNMSEPEEVQLTPKSFKKMKRLRILIIHNAQCSGDRLEYLPNELRWLEWPGYPFSSMPDNFSPKKLVVFGMPNSRLKLSHPISWFKGYKHLICIELTNCEFITEVSDLSGCCNLKELNLAGCSRLKEFPEIDDIMDRLQIIYLDRTGIEELPSSIERIIGLQYLYLSSCQNLTKIPSCIYKLQKLEELGLYNCTKLGKFPVFTSLNEGSGNIGSASSLNLFPSLRELNLGNCNLSEVDFLTNIEHFPALDILFLDKNNITTIPACLYQFAKLGHFYVRNCKLLQEIPQTPPNILVMYADGCESLQRFSQLISTHGDQLTSILRPQDFNCSTHMKLIDHEFISEVPNLSRRQNLKFLKFTGCSRLKEFPKIVDNMNCLTQIYLDRTGIEEVPSSIECITRLQQLHMSYCGNLTNISSCIYKLQELEWLKCDNCPKLGKFPVFSNKKQKLNEGSSNTGSTSSLNLFPSLRILDLTNCNLSEVNFLTNTEHFPALSFLWLGGNNITIFPSCLHKFAELTHLDVSNCKLLQKIPKLPIGTGEIKYCGLDTGKIKANGCESLQIYSQLESILRRGSNGDQLTSILRCEGFVNIVHMLILGNEIPNWFSHKSSKNSISLRLPINTSVGLIALAHSAIRRSTSVDILVFINDKWICTLENVWDHSMESGNLWLCYIPQIFPSSFKGDYADVEVKVSGKHSRDDLEDSLEDIDVLESKILGVHLIEGW